MAIIVGFDTIGDYDPKSELPSANGQSFDLSMRSVWYDEIVITSTLFADITDNTRPEWTIRTYLLAKFQDNLEAGNIGLGGLPITGYKIRRRKISSLNFINLATVPVAQDGNFYYLDRSPVTSVTYEYEVIPMSGDIEGQAFTTQIKCDYKYWWIADDEESYPLFANLEVSDISSNIQRHVYTEGFDEFPTVSYGTQKYQSGTITAWIVDGNLETSKTYRDNLIRFLNNKKRKYLKSPKGDIWIVDTHSESHKFYEGLYRGDKEDDVISVTFSWTEVAKFED